MSQSANNNNLSKSKSLKQQHTPPSSLIDLLLPKTLTYKTIITSFLTDLYTDIFERSNRVINTYTFQELTQLPMIINEKLYITLTNHEKGLLSLSQFSNGIYELLYDDFDKKISFTFKLFDFDNDKVIHKQDVYLILSHFHLIENPSSSLKDLENIINVFFGVDSNSNNNNNNEMTLNVYEKKVFNTNCDIALLLIIFMTNYLILYRKTELKLFKKLYMKKNKYHPSRTNKELKYNINLDKYKYTNEFVEYVDKLKLKERPETSSQKPKKNINIDLDNSDDSIIISDSEEEKDLDDLNTFEKDMNSIFNKINGDSFKIQKTLCPSRSLTIKSFVREQEQKEEKKKLRHVATVDLANNKTSHDLIGFANISTVAPFNKNTQKNPNLLKVRHNFLNSSFQDDSALSNHQNRSTSPIFKQQNQLHTGSTTNSNSNTNNNIIQNGKSNSQTNQYIINPNTTSLSHTLPENMLIAESKKANHFQLLKSVTSYSPLINGRKPKSFKRRVSFGVNVNDNNKSPVIFVYKCKDEITTETKLKLILVNKYIFVFRKEEKHNCFKYKKFFPIISIFPSTMRMNKKITKINFHSSIHNYVKTITYIGENNNADIERFINEMNKRNGYNSISDDYELQNEIGKGKFGHVLLAKHIKGDKRGGHYAVKIIKKNPTCEEEYKINRWESSIFNMLINVTHPNVIRCYNKYETIDRILFVYEFVEGHDLKTFIKKSYDLNKKVNLIALTSQIIEGICYIHKLGIIHRDIKTTNILVDTVNNNRIKIIDFGLSRVLGHLECSLDPYGSLCFKAPEILKSIPYSFKVDIWALGVTLYYLVFKQLPFEKGTKNDIKKSILSETVVYPSNNLRFEGNKGNGFVINIIKECLEREVEQRPSSFDLIYQQFGKEGCSG